MFDSKSNLKIKAMSYFIPVLIRVSIAAMKHHDQKQVGEERAYSVYVSTLYSKIRIETQTGQKPEAGGDAEAMEGCCLLACSSWVAQPAFLENSGPKAQ